MKRGKLIVIEGIDGSGKETQTKLLIKELEKRKFKVKVMDFPQYGKTFFGDVVGRFLKGDFGTLKEVNPYLAALTFAGDRWQAKDEINKYLDKGYIVILNRYAMSNMAHQGSKVFGKARRDLLDFLDELEYKVYGIPREDLDILLDLPANVGKKLILKKSQRNYLGTHKKRDIHEGNVNYQNETRKLYLKLSEKYNYVKKVDCSKKGELKSIEDIHELVWNVASTFLGVK